MITLNNVVVAEFKRNGWSFNGIVHFNENSDNNGYPKVRVRSKKWRKKGELAQPEWPKQDRKILKRCTSQRPCKPRTPSEDKVAVL
jgi:hypothetical protein